MISKLVVIAAVGLTVAATEQYFVSDNSIARSRVLISIAHGFIEALKVGELEKRLEVLEMTLKTNR